MGEKCYDYKKYICLLSPLQKWYKPSSGLYLKPSYIFQWNKDMKIHILLTKTKTFREYLFNSRLVQNLHRRYGLFLLFQFILWLLCFYVFAFSFILIILDEWVNPSLAFFVWCMKISYPLLNNGYAIRDCPAT